MTLSKEQIKATKSEFAENLALADLTIVEVAKELNTSQVKIERIFNLKQRSLNDGWILRNYLLRKVTEVGKDTSSVYSAQWGLSWILVFRWRRN